MKEKIFPVSLLVLALFFEIFITTIPFIVGIFILLSIVWRKNWIFFAAFLAGIVFDIFTLRAIGSTSVFLIFLVFLIFIYQNKFEIETLPFVFVSSFISSVAFLIILGYSGLIIEPLIVSLVSLGLFKFLSSGSRGKIIN